MTGMKKRKREEGAREVTTSVMATEFFSTSKMSITIVRREGGGESLKEENVLSSC